MSLKDIDVVQKKNPTDVVHWNEYEALCDHLQRQILNATKPLHEGVQNVELGLKDDNETINETQRQVTEVQRTLTAMQQAMTALQASVDRQQHRQHDDDGEASTTTEYVYSMG
jgi:hypothetical protein